MAVAAVLAPLITELPGARVLPVVVVAAALRLAGMDLPVEFIAAALCTTALGTLLPTRLGRHAVAAGMCGELFPIIVISVVLTSTAERALEAALLIVFALVIVACAIGALRVRPRFAATVFVRTMHATSQLPVRACILLLVMLVYLATDFGLDLVLGAFAAGMVVRLALGSGEMTHELEHKLDAIGFGFLIPVFFITTGLTFDLDGLLGDPQALALVPLFLLAFLAVCGVPVLLYRGELGGRERLTLAFHSATTLPLVVAITTIAVAGGHMRTETSAALVAAAMLSVVLFELVALVIRGRTPAMPATVQSAVPLGA